MSQFQNSTVREMASNSMAELAHEQAYLTMLYERLDVLKTSTDQRLAEVRLGPTAENDQGWSERESFAQLYQDRTAELDAAERNLCFGRLDFDDGDHFYSAGSACAATITISCWSIGVPVRRSRSTAPHH